jgi:4,5-DOPA dioxygenase extradiol
MTVRMPVAFFGHGSPMVAIQASTASRTWNEVAAALPRPKSILVVSAHWETNVTAVTAMTRPRTIHDFGASFPKALFDKQYPAPGDPALARRVAELLAPGRVVLDESQWGLDHGAWSVLVHAYPEADVPVVQLSLDVNLTPAQRFEIGRQLQPLRDEGVLILGTGNVVHNLRAMDWGNAAAAPFDWAERFNDEMRRAVVDDQPERAVAFADLGQDAKLAAPSPEHFWPLLYILGARAPGDRARLFNDWIEHGSLGMMSFVFEDQAQAKAA